MRRLLNHRINKRTYMQAMLGLILILTACNVAIPQVDPTATVIIPTPQAFTTASPDVEAAVWGFLNAWQAEDYTAMYNMLTTSAQGGITEEAFVQRYTDVASEAGLVEISYEIGYCRNSAPQGEAAYLVTFVSGLVGDIKRNMKMDLVLEDGAWKVNWNDGLILPELAGGNYLKMDSSQPERSAIFDRTGNPIASQKEAAAIGVWPDYVNLKDDGNLISMLSGLSLYSYDTIATWIELADIGAYLPLGEIPADQDPRRLDLLSTWGAAVVSKYSRRLYYDNGIAPHFVGYVSPIQEDEVDVYKRKGYRSDERVGRKGIELWAEDILMGKRGGALYVFGPDGRLVSELGKAPNEPGQDITTTLNRDFQREVQKAMSVFSGAAVVLERDTGRVIAIASSPGFDPNAFEIENFNWNTTLSEIVNNPNSPQFNRATQGQYPLGSVFKIITIAAAFESERYTAETTYDCQYTFEELPGFTRYDWTYEHFKEDEVTQPTGMITAPQALIRSCNPFFWHVGLDLYRNGLTTAIAEMSRGFGLGSITGIEVVEEEAGNIPEPGSDVDAINLAIGQGDMLVTPIQVARFVAAVGNGGTLYRPQIIEKIAPQNGSATFTFKPEEQGKLPVKPETLTLIQEAMKGVVTSEKPRGTAWRPMNGLDVPVAGKTGTATAPSGEPHAWFAGYTYAGQLDKPDIAIAVIAENAGEGSEIAAPIFRRIVEWYFFGKAYKLYPWEANFNVTRSPTPLITNTPNVPTPKPNINP